MGTYICPLDYENDAGELLQGCGDTFAATPDEEGFVDCPSCGLWHRPQPAVTREERLRALCERHDLEIRNDRFDNSGEEDIAAYFYDGLWEAGEGRAPIQTWATVTVQGDFTYIKADCESLEEACRSAMQYIDDDIFEEVPICVVNLDTGEEYQPVWSETPWRATK